ncbi:MAG TPA: hypothetical protein VF290_04550 [Pyrinomonadaceae bacterium]
MMKILIGHDGSQSAGAALVDLQRGGLPVEAEALIVSAAEPMSWLRANSSTDKRTIVTKKWGKHPVRFK